MNKNERSGVSDRSPIQNFMLARLEQYRDMLSRGQNTYPSNRMQLIRHAAYSTYRDLAEMGLADEARAIIQRRSTDQPQPKTPQKR
jgi:hypothetical protein